MKDLFNSVLFAVSREDYKVEASLIQNNGFNNLLTVCSGGCVPMSLKVVFPNLNITAYDINQHQIEHLKKKQEAVAKSDFGSLNIRVKGDFNLNQLGKFDRMFQKLRESFTVNVAKSKTINKFFKPSIKNDEREVILLSWKNHKNVDIPFNATFSDEMIEAVFSDQATKQGEAGTYIQYFKNKIFRELSKNNSHKNPFLQHIFLGYYLSENPFPYTQLTDKAGIKFFHGNICDVSNINSFDLISLSNLFDWSDDNFVRQCIKKLKKINKGSSVLIRQLNNHRDWFSFFQNDFIEDKAFDLFWQKKDRSMFYDHFRLFKKT